MKNKAVYILLALLMSLPVLSGCNNTDDVTSIFTGRTWRLTYITKANNHGWYKFENVTEENLMEYVEGKKIFRMVFAGNESNDIIQGTATGSGSINCSGPWNANAKKQTFNMTVTGSPVDNSDNLGKRILEGLRNADSYKGSDNRNLFLYYQPDLGSETFCLVFAPN